VSPVARSSLCRLAEKPPETSSTVVYGCERKLNVAAFLVEVGRCLLNESVQLPRAIRETIDEPATILAEVAAETTHVHRERIRELPQRLHLVRAHASACAIVRARGTW